jgi:hypothetical protein
MEISDEDDEDSSKSKSKSKKKAEQENQHSIFHFNKPMGLMPIMVKSKACRLHGLSPKKLVIDFYENES